MCKRIELVTVDEGTHKASKIHSFTDCFVTVEDSHMYVWVFLNCVNWIVFLVYSAVLVLHEKSSLFHIQFIFKFFIALLQLISLTSNFLHWTFWNELNFENYKNNTISGNCCLAFRLVLGTPSCVSEAVLFVLTTSVKSLDQITWMNVGSHRKNFSGTAFVWLQWSIDKSLFVTWNNIHINKLVQKWIL